MFFTEVELAVLCGIGTKLHTSRPCCVVQCFGELQGAEVFTRWQPGQNNFLGPGGMKVG
jgi:hypothetical protein